MGNFNYFKVDIKFTRNYLATCPDASIYEQHLLEKSKKLIKEANKMEKKVTKALAKYKNSEITPEKELKELQGIVRRYFEVLGRTEDLPDNIEDLMALSSELEAEVQEMVKKGETQKCTVFMRDEDGKPLISTHQLIGMIKEVLKVQTNNTPKGQGFCKSKVQAQEIIGLDIRPVEEFFRPNQDLARDRDGKPLLYERPIRFEDNFGNTVTAIALSEYLHEGAEMSCHLRVRKDSPIGSIETLTEILDLGGKNMGLGQNRRSGFGQFKFKITECENPEKDAEGWI